MVIIIRTVTSGPYPEMVELPERFLPLQNLIGKFMFRGAIWGILFGSDKQQRNLSKNLLP